MKGVKLVIKYLMPYAFTSTETMSSLLTDLGTVVTQVLTWVGNVASTIVGTPLLLMTTGFLVLGGAIGIFGRLLSKN